MQDFIHLRIVLTTNPFLNQWDGIAALLNGRDFLGSYLLGDLRLRALGAASGLWGLRSVLLSILSALPTTLIQPTDTGLG